jgi:hypothetical protein
MKKSIFILVGLFLVLSQAPGLLAEIIYVPWTGTYADKSTLYIRWGAYEDHLALEFACGPLQTTSVGIVFAERTTDTDKFKSAVIRLHNLLELNNPNLNDFAKSLGLTFQEFVSVDKIKGVTERIQTPA